MLSSISLEALNLEGQMKSDILTSFEKKITVTVDGLLLDGQQ